MNLRTQAFNQVRDLKDFVNDHGIEKSRIVNIFQSSDGLYQLLYYED